MDPPLGNTSVHHAGTSSYPLPMTHKFDLESALVVLNWRVEQTKKLQLRESVRESFRKSSMKIIEDYQWIFKVLVEAVLPLGWEHEGTHVIVKILEHATDEEEPDPERLVFFRHSGDVLTITEKSKRRDSMHYRRNG